MQKVRGHPGGLPLFVGMWFQVLFHSPLGVLFTFPSRYWFTIGQRGVLSLGGWSPQIPPGFHVSEGTQESHWPASVFVYGGITLYAAASQLLPLTSTIPHVSPTTPTQKPGLVWALPRSLAATDGVSVDFLSYGYLDVSVPRVGFSLEMTCKQAGFPHSDIPGSSRACPLPEAYRRLLRPSSPLVAKASTTCPS